MRNWLVTWILIWGLFADLFTTTFSPYLLRFFTVNYALRLNKHRYFGSQTKFVRHITFAQFLIIIIIIIIMAPKRTFFFVRHITFAQFLIIIISPKRSLWDILLLLCFLLHQPDYCRVMYCYSTFLFHYYYYYYYYYYYCSSTHFCPLYFSEMPWSNFMKPCRNIICHVKFCC